MRQASYRLDRVEGSLLVFSAALNYRDCLTVLNSLQRGNTRDITVTVEDSFTRFIDARKTFIDEKSRLGNGLKKNTTLFEQQRKEFEDTLSQFMIRPLRKKQMIDSFYMTIMGRCANFSVPGSGKTASVLGAFAYLKSRNKVSRLLVICPKSAFESWEKEWRLCFGRRISASVLSFGDPQIMRLNSQAKRRVLSLDYGNKNFILLNYEGVGSYLEEIAQIAADDSLLVFDEVHRVKAIGGLRASWALKIAKDAKYCYTMTGTPIPNTYADVYNFLHLMYPDDYDDFFGFDPGVLRNPSQSEISLINERLRPFFCRTNKDELGVPRPLPDKRFSVRANEEENRLFHILKAAYFDNPLALIIRIMQLESDPQMLSRALDPSDFEYILDQAGENVTDINFVDYSSEVPFLIGQCHETAKLVRCENTVLELVERGKPVIVWCIFVHSITRIVKDLRSFGIQADCVFGATPFEEREQILDDFRSGVIQVLVTNPHTLAESVSLHQICHDSVYFEYSYNLVHMLQSKDRINRLGLPAGQYTQYHFVATVFNNGPVDYSLDNKIYERLLEKEGVMREAIDADVLEPGYVDEDDARVVLQGLFAIPGDQITPE